jgi:hypothetical protein
VNASTTVPAPATPDAVVTCHKMYAADLRPTDRFAFMMSVHVTGQSFTVYAAEPDAYTVGAEYTLTLAPRTAPGPSPAAEDAGTGR